MQELDQFEEFWKGFFLANGYSGVWKKRTQGTASKKDGCGVFYKRDRYELLARKGVEYNDIAFGREVAEEGGENNGDSQPDESASQNNSSSQLETLLTSTPENDSAEAIALLPDTDKVHVRDCVGVLTVLREKNRENVGDGDIPKNQKKPVLVASTHLFWDPNFPEVKLKQTERLLEETQEFAKKYSKVHGNLPIIIAGDFNSVPGSEVHLRMLKGFSAEFGGLKSAYAEALKKPPGFITQQKPGQKDTITAGDSKHNEPAHSNCTPGFTECIDYVFVTDDVSVTSAEPISGPATTFQGLPDLTHPSDHLPITVTVEF